VPPLYQLTIYTPTKSNLYLDNSLAAAAPNISSSKSHVPFSLLRSYYLIIHFKSYLCSTVKDRNVSDANISVIFSIILFSVFTDILIRGFMFKWDLNQACETSWACRQWQVQRSDAGAQFKPCMFCK